MKTWVKIILLLSIVIAVAFSEILFIEFTNWSEHPAPCIGCPNPVPEYYIQYLQTVWTFLFFINILFSVFFAYITKEAFPEKKVTRWILSILILLAMTGLVSYYTLILYVSW